MKMKRLRNLLILILIVITFGTTRVNAESFVVGDKYTKDWKRSIGFTNYVDRNGNNKIIIEGLTIPKPINRGLTVIPYEITKVGTNNKILGYCIDPHLQSDTTYKIDYILGASKDKTNNAIGLGVLEIMKQGYSEFSGMPTISTSLSDRDFYVATSIAIRAFAMGVGGQGKGTASNSELIAIASAHVNIGREWLAQSSYSNSFSDLVKYNPSWFNNEYKFVYDESNSKITQIMEVAQKLFDIGLAKANEVTNGLSTTPTITSKSSNRETGVSIELSYENFDASRGVIKNFKLECSSCSNFKVNGETPNTNKNYINGSNGKIRLTFDVAKQGENCKTTNYKITYDYNDPKLEYVGAHLIPTGQTNAQNFYVMQKNEGGLTGEITGKIKCSNACSTELQTPICSEDENKAIATIKGPDKIKTCVLDNEDDAGNTYQFTPAAGGVSNDYCNVFCKEDYAQIKMNPIIKDVKCGGYFKLTSHIEGTKTCYTSGTKTDKGIDKEKFEKDIKEAVEKMVDAYNEYAKWSAAAAIESTKTTATCSYTGRTCLDENNEVKENCETCSSGSKSEDTYEKSWSWYTYNYNGVKSSVASTDSYGPGTPKDGTCSCTLDTYSNRDDIHKTNAKNAKENLEKAIKNYNKILSDYNSCTTGWTTDFLFKQKLRYYYDENHGKNGSNYTPYYDLIATDEYKEKQYLTPDGNQEVKTTISVCTGNTDNYYNCISGKNVYNSESELKDSSIFKSVGYTVCDTTGCKVVNESVSQARFVKKEVEKKQDYVTPTAFYQIAANGKITVNGNYSGNKVQLEALLNGLPISTSTVGGGVFRLMIEDLGEFYDEKEGTGRLIDFNGDREESSIAYNNGANTFDGNYTCRYESPCKPKDCPNCTFECIGDSCEWKQCTGDLCDVACNGCIINLDELNIIHKTISTTNFHAANRTFGYNWITTSNLESLKLLNKKAEKTISEIEEVNEMVYDKTGDDSELAFSIKMTPDVINTIKEYNKKHTKDGGYINDSLTCYDATIDGKTYQNIYCYSDLIDELIDKYDDAITANNRLENNESKRKSETGSSGYWTLWSGYVYNESVLGGPSWK